MPQIDVPLFGTLTLCLALVTAAYTFAVSVGAGRGRPHLLTAARYGAYATSAFVLLAVLLLAWAFQAHDFRIRYVARYSDRSMPLGYLIASLWGGQDGSLLWWTFLLGGYTTAVTRWMRGRVERLQPWVIATQMSVFLFFLVLMLFASNPFATGIGAAPIDGEGLNPLLQNYWMVIHPPSLYMGFVGWSVPFGFVVAALITGRLGDEWVKASRIWSLIPWTFLSIGLILGCVWSYEELGWGGYWAWDPVENASFMPWLVGTAYLHSAMVQERYALLRVWNVFLMCLTFFMTIFGTFLTRSGAIASVHAFSRSDIGQYFVWYMGFLIIVCAALIIWRLPKLKAEHKIQSLLSREFFFLLNNWVLLGMMIFVLIATTFPMISEALRGQTVTVGPPFYNEWMVPFGLVLLLLTGIGPLVSWRKATGRNLMRALMIPAILGLVVGGLHVIFGAGLGLPAYVPAEQLYDTIPGHILGFLRGVAPVVSTTLSTFVLSCILQEFVRGTRVRMRKGESAPKALLSLMSRARRRYGGYTVHIGIVIMYLGFTGAAWDQEYEAALRPGETMQVGDFQVRYDGPQTLQDPNKRMIFAFLTLLDSDGNELGTMAPAKFIYRTHPEMPTTEVYIRSNLFEDIYVIMSTVDPTSQRGTFRVVERPLVNWIWIGGLVLVFGALLAMWPTKKQVLARLAEEREHKRRAKAVGVGVALVLLLGSLLPASPGLAQAPPGSEHFSSSIVIRDPAERQLFSHLLCQCGDCERDPLNSCDCGWAQDKRSELRALLAANHTPEELEAQYRARFGAAAISVPSDSGFDRTIWAVPVGAIALAAVGLFWMGRRWRHRGEEPPPADKAPGSGRSDTHYDDKLEAELDKLEGDQ
ncbi:MAG: cytochrome c biogenesis protein CcsA [Deltaproteobacteria bacterium]|nr:cytochrome c biogenesis protein CcsA [Deltaproteobacteria bacterium]